MITSEVSNLVYRKLSQINYTALQQLTQLIFVVWLYLVASTSSVVGVETRFSGSRSLLLFGPRGFCVCDWSE